MNALFRAIKCAFYWDIKMILYIFMGAITNRTIKFFSNSYRFINLIDYAFRLHAMGESDSERKSDASDIYNEKRTRVSPVHLLEY